MKKILLVFLITICFQNTNALNIENIIVSPINEGINIHLRTREASLFYYHAYEYNITDNVITLKVCYIPGLQSTLTFLENDFQIPLDNTNIIDYNLIVNIYYMNSSFSCDYQIIKDFESLPFTSPLNTAVSLSSTEFENNKISFTLFPNPTTGILNFNQKIITANTINIFDQLGRLVKTLYSIDSGLMDIKDLDDGIYLVEINTVKEKITRKIVLKK